MPQKKQAVIYWSLMLLGSCVLIIGAYVFRFDLRHFRSLGLLGIFLANLLGSATLFLPAPAVATVVAGGALYPPLLVGLSATLGAVIGDSLGYVLGFSGSRVALKREHKTYMRIKHVMHTYAGIIIFLFAFFPNPFFDAIGIIAGAINYPFSRFVLWLTLGRLTRNILLAFFGSQLMTMF